MKKIIQELKAFAMRGNVVDMAVGVIIGGAFGKICIIAGRRYYHAVLYRSADRRCEFQGFEVRHFILLLSVKEFLHRRLP